MIRIKGSKKQTLQCSTCKNNKGSCWTDDESKCVRYLPKENTNLIKIDGVVETPPEVDSDVFCQMFINWIESLGYAFGGGVSPLMDDEESR